MSPDINKCIVREMIDGVWNAGRPDRLPEFWAERTRDEAAGLTTAFPDLQVRIDDIVAEADRVVVRLTFTGTHRGPFRDVAPTGNPVSFGVIRIYQLADGKVVDTWAQQDALTLMAQLRGGVSP